MCGSSRAAPTSRSGSRRSSASGARRACSRKTISGRLGLRVTPELAFFYDEGVDNLTRIEMLLEEVKADERSRKG